ncbi:MAG: response regulator [Oscillospiraceae bacterium]
MSKRIMVVDDDAITIKMCDFILKKFEYEVVTMNSGISALEYLRNPASEPVDLIFLDIEMPLLNGFNTLSSIRQSSALKDIPVVFLTATATKETVEEAIKLGVTSYIKKPFKPQELINKAQEILGAAE